MNVQIHPIELLPTHQRFLQEALYQCIHVPKGHTPPPRSLLQQPDLARYILPWHDEDTGFFASLNGDFIGAAWLRFWNDEAHGYGYIRPEIPELSMSVMPEYRGRGIGGLLLEALIDIAETQGFSISLSVQRSNPAKRLYERYEFVRYGESGEADVMLRTTMLSRVPHT